MLGTTHPPYPRPPHLSSWRQAARSRADPVSYSPRTPSTSPSSRTSSLPALVSGSDGGVQDAAGSRQPACWSTVVKSWVVGCWHLSCTAQHACTHASLPLEPRTPSSTPAHPARAHAPITHDADTVFSRLLGRQGVSTGRGRGSACGGAVGIAEVVNSTTEPPTDVAEHLLRPRAAGLLCMLRRRRGTGDVTGSALRVAPCSAQVGGPEPHHQLLLFFFKIH